MHKISFDAEDFPPPSYYYGEDEDDPKKSTEISSGLLRAAGLTSSSPSASNRRSSPSDLAPVHQSGGKRNKEEDKSGMEKADWWKAPEFVPRSVHLSSNGSFVTSSSSSNERQNHNQQQHESVNSISKDAVSTSGSSQIPFQQLASPSTFNHHPQHQQHMSTSSHHSQTPPPPIMMARSRTPGGMMGASQITPPLPPAAALGGFPIGLPQPAPAFIPLPLAGGLPPPPGAAGHWAPPGAGHHHVMNPAALAVLQHQLARVYAHNPRIATRGAQPHGFPQLATTAYHNQKLQQLILQQQHNQFRHRQQQQSLLPFGPSGGVPPPIMTTSMVRGGGSGGAAPGSIPTGYTANMTTIDAGLGRSFPAIVLKRKRKKKNKRNNNANFDEANRSKGSNKSNAVQGDSLTRSMLEERCGSGGDEDMDDEEEAMTASTLVTSGHHLAEHRRSEPDLTKLQHLDTSSATNQQIKTSSNSTTTPAVCDVLIGTAGDPNHHHHQNGHHYPNDLDLIQNAPPPNCVMITGSCPDLSIDELDFGMINQSPTSAAVLAVMSKSHHINPFLREEQEERERSIPDLDLRPINNNGGSKSSSRPNPNQTVVHTNEEEFDLDTNPVVRDAMRDLASDGMIKSSKVKELNRQIVREMRQQEKLPKWTAANNEDWSDPEMDEDDTIFERLLKNENTRQETARKDLETNPGRGQKSLKEEMEEGLMVFRNRAAREYGRVSQLDDDDEEDDNSRLLNGADDDGGGPKVHRTAITHGSRAANTELYKDRQPKSKSKPRPKSSLIPRSTFVESELEDEERMRITVNTLEALDVDGADTFLAKSHLRSMAAGSNNFHQSMDDLNTKKQRRYSVPDSSSSILPPLTRSRNCCAVM